MNLEEVLTKVRAEEEKKSDVVTNLLSTIPLLEGNQTILKLGRNTRKGFTQTGLSSYLQKIDVPIGHFNKCSSHLKRETLAEFHTNNAKQDVMLRLYNDDIRFIASSKYAKYDDVNIIEALQDINSPLEVREINQSENFFVMRALTENPIEIPGLRPYYPGIQIMNSEVGRSAVKAQLVLWEEVCTNGMIVQNQTLGGFGMIHLGKDRDRQLRSGVNVIVGQLDQFVKDSEEKLKALSSHGGKELFDKLLANKNVPQRLTNSITDQYLSKYTDDKVEDSTALDVMSAFTESIQGYDWDARSSLERTAGDYLWAA